MDRGTREHYRNAIALLILAGGARLVGGGIALYHMAQAGLPMNPIADARLAVEIGVALLTLLLAVAVLVRPRACLLPASAALLAQAAWLRGELLGYPESLAEVWKFRILLGCTGVSGAYLIYVWWRLGQPQEKPREDELEQAPT